MYECESSDEDDETEKVGKKYKINLNDLQSPNSKALNFLYKMKSFTKKRERALNMINQ